MKDRKSFLIRIDPGLHSALERWAKDDLRSLNGQIEYLLQEALRRRGDRIPDASEPSIEPGPRLGEGTA
jgi:hypothetical protein